jgi:hypothetical protein
MIIEIFERYNYHAPQIPIKVARVQCDVCGKEFIRDLRKFDAHKRHHCSRSCRQTGIKLTAEQRERISKKLIGRKKSIAMRQKLSVNNACHRPEVRQKLSESRSQGIAEGRIQPFYRGHHGTYVSTKTRRCETYHSWLERDRMAILDADPEVISWTKSHGISIPYMWHDHVRHYVPDFMIQFSDRTVVEEVKGWSGEETLAIKLSVLREYCEHRGFVMNYVCIRDVQRMLESLGLQPTSRMTRDNGQSQNEASNG